MNNIPPFDIILCERPPDLKTKLGPSILLIDNAEHLRRVNYALSLDLPSMAEFEDQFLGETIEIVGSGPSLVHSLGHLAETKNKILALNGAHDFLLNCGIKPDFAMMLDPHDWCAGYQTPTEGVKYFIGTTCHPSVFRRFMESGVTPYFYVPIYTETEYEDTLPKYQSYDVPADKKMLFVAGATTVGLRAVNASMSLGFITCRLHGFDSCYAIGNDGVKGKALHAHRKHFVWDNTREVSLVSKVNRRKFTCITNNAMARQIIGFESMVQSMGNFTANGRLGLTRLIVHGDGAIPWMAWADGGPSAYVEHAEPEKMRAKYGDWEHWNYEKDTAV